MNIDYHFDGQLRRVMKHIIALFGGFHVSTGTDVDGNPILRKVTCRYGDMHRQVATILNNNSENMMQSAPFMTIDIERHQMSREGVRSPVVQDFVVSTNKQDVDGNYTKEKDKSYHVSRMNPVPWDLEFKVDIWTTNTQNKTELQQQIAMFFTPSIMLQLTTNSLDWSGTIDIEMTGFDWTSRNRPEGVDFQIDVCTFSFKTQMWYTPPAKVREATQIHQVVASIIDDTDPFTQDTLGSVVVTPNNHIIRLDKDTDVGFTDRYVATLLSSSGKETSLDGELLSWERLFAFYGEFQDGLSQMRLQRTYEDASPIIGNISMVDADTMPNKVYVDIDDATFNVVTLDDINGFIDPHQHIPNDALPTPATGHRYVCLVGIDLNVPAWNNSTGAANIVNTSDIIEYNGTNWVISFTAASNTDDQFVKNGADGVRYQYTNDNGWFEEVYNIYREGMFRLILNEE